MDSLELFQRLAVALAIGLLIGLERGWQAREDAEGERALGFRTLALSGLLGGVWGALARHAGEAAGIVALALAFATFTAVITLFRYRESVLDKTLGATTLIAGMLVFALGAFAVIGSMQVAGAIGVTAAALLSLKASLHAWLRRLTWEELRSGLVLLTMTLVLLPVLPNRAIDPLGAINPFEIWLLTIMIAAIAFTGYAAIKIAGDRAGIVITAISGGLVSSTAVTVTLARLAREHPEQRDAMVAGMLLSGATMLGRVLVLVLLLHQALGLRLAVPALAGACVLLASALLLLRRRREASGAARGIALKNPFDLGTVLKFGALLTVISMLGSVATRWGGSGGVYALAAVSGLADVDALTLSMARQSGSTLSLTVAARAIAIVVAVNSIAKAVLAGITGGVDVGRRLAVPTLAMLAAGALAVAIGPGL